MLDLKEIHAADGLGCELCSLREQGEGRDVVAHIRAVDDLERRAATGEIWQLCQCCQIALALWDSAGVDDLPSA
ncbi:MAG TPA: hypothetical protein DEA71_13340 [Nitrospira sp.]|nr:hypothetical protein [Nitrospira sp.]HBR51058.1 hypothetical protein [Nitrospira sp.]